MKHENLREESDRVLAGFLPITHAVDNRMTNISTKMHSTSPSLPPQPHLHSTSSQSYTVPGPVTPLDGAPELPLHLKEQIQVFCEIQETQTLPCARALFSKQGQSTLPFRYEDAVTGNALATSLYKYGQDKFLTVVHHSQDRSSIINYMPGANGETKSRKLYGIWFGIRGWEKTPSVAKVFGGDGSIISHPQPSTTVVQHSPATTLGSSTFGVSRRQARHEAKQKIRSSLKRQRRGSYGWEEESEEDSGNLYFIISSLHCVDIIRSSYLASPTNPQAFQYPISSSAIRQLERVAELHLGSFYNYYARIGTRLDPCNDSQ